MAWPIPREAPVTSAMSFSKHVHGFRSGCGRGNRGREGFGIFEREGLRLAALVDALDQASEHPARAAFDDCA